MRSGGFCRSDRRVLMILDADLRCRRKRCEISCGDRDREGRIRQRHRLIYPMEHEAMRPLNLIANRCFAYLFSYLVNTG